MYNARLLTEKTKGKTIKKEVIDKYLNREMLDTRETIIYQLNVLFNHFTFAMVEKRK